MHKIINSDIFGRTLISKLMFENSNGISLKIDMDFLGIIRNLNPTLGPFEFTDSFQVKIKIW